MLRWQFSPPAEKLVVGDRVPTQGLVSGSVHYGSLPKVIMEVVASLVQRLEVPESMLICSIFGAGAGADV